MDLPTACKEHKKFHVEDNPLLSSCCWLCPHSVLPVHELAVVCRMFVWSSLSESISMVSFAGQKCH
jgi:hypothetical protein